MTTALKKFATLFALVALGCALALCCTGCQEKASYQAVVVSEQNTPGDLFVVQSANGEMTSGLIVLQLPEKKTTADPATLKPGDLLDVFGSDQIALSYPGQASCTNIKLADHIDTQSPEYAPFEAEWQAFAGRFAAA